MSRYADNATISGSIVVTGSATFNDQSKDVDFIVESDNNTHMLFVDAGNDKVGIGTSSPDYTLDVAGNIGVDQYIYHNGDADTLINFANDKIVLKAGNRALVTAEVKSSQPHEVTINDGSNNVDFVVKGNGSGEGNPGMKFDASTNRLGINGVGTPDEALHIDGNLKIVGNDPRIKIDGDTDSHPGLELYENGTRKWIIFNNYGDDDLSFKTNSDTRMVIEQDGNVGIGTTSPGANLHVNSSGDTSLIVEGTQDVTLGLVADTDNSGGEDQNPSFYMSQETSTDGAYQFLMGLEGTADLSYTGSYTNQPFILSLNSETHTSLRTFQIATADGSDVSSRFSIATGGRIAIGDGVQAADTRLHIKEAPGDIFKMENTTAYGVTYGQLVKEDLTITEGGSPLDTTLDLPARAMITDVLITIKTAGGGSSCYLENIALTANSQTNNIKGSSFPSGLSLISNPSQGVTTGTQYVLGNSDQSFPAGQAAMLLSSTADVKIVYAASGITGNPVVDVVVFYKKFDAS